MNISIQGEKGSFHDQVAYHYFKDKDYQLLERSSFREVFEDTANTSADFGIIAIENSLAGSLGENYDLLLTHNVYIVHEVYLPISHCLITNPGVHIDEITEVLSHPMALKQCDQYLRSNPYFLRREMEDTAGSVSYIKENKMQNSAAIASKYAANIYNMQILKEAIETHKQNYTRFFVLSHMPQENSENTKSSLAFSVNNTPGSLVKSLQIFDNLGINLTKIESRPIIGQNWQYIFYIDCEKGIESELMTTALEQLKEFSNWIKVLGSYQTQRIEK